MKTPLVSIIVPVYKAEKYLHNCVVNVLNQTYTNWELILVDDGSPDNCPVICDEYAVKDVRIKAIHKTNGGVASARNIGIDLSKGVYLTFLDSDDFWHVDYLQSMVELCLLNDADISQCNFTYGTETSFPTSKKKNINRIYNNYTVFSKSAAKVIVCAKLYKRYLFEGLKMPEGILFEDDFSTWKWYYKAKKIVVTEDSLYYYTQNSESTMAGHLKEPSLIFMQAYNERITFFIDNGEKSMEDFSRIHYCKALVLTAANRRLTEKQKKLVNSTFLENWNKIKHSKKLGITLRLLYLLYRFTPKITLSFLNFVR